MCSFIYYVDAAKSYIQYSKGFFFIDCTFNMQYWQIYSEIYTPWVNATGQGPKKSLEFRRYFEYI
jgi:hypothetical protein